MRCITVGAATLNQTPLDWKGNLKNIFAAIDEAEIVGVGLLCLPELCITGYGCEDQFYSIDMQKRAQESLIQIREYLENHNLKLIVTAGLPVMFRNALFNTVAVVSKTGIHGLVAKQHLAGDGLHYEPRWFKEWPAGATSVVQLHGEDSPAVTIGDLIFEADGIRFGFEICEDAWVAKRPGSSLAERGVDIIINASASHFGFGKYQIRERFVTEGSRAFGATYILANLLGNESGQAIYDGGCLIATKGEIVARGPRFSFCNYELTTAVIDVEATRRTQSSTASFHPTHGTDEKNNVSWIWDIHESTSGVPTAPVPPLVPMSKFDEFSAALPLALWDYVRKSHSKGFAISLSGGADSAACTILVYMMLLKAVGTLTPQVVEEVLGLPRCDSFAELCNRTITCVYQSTKNSSKTTLNAAKAVAQDVGAKFKVIDVSDIVEAYVAKAEKVLGRKMTWDQDDIALQNIQARVRAPSIWMVANTEQKLLIATANRSEAAVGYCTMDGDTAGSISPISGTDKFFLLVWLKHISTSFGSLEKILVQKPTAELRPKSKTAQTDETDLMPYEILEDIEHLAIVEKRSPIEVYRILAPKHVVTIPQETLKGYIVKFYRLWCRNQWKRIKFPLGFNVGHNLDPRSWCRFPVLSGGFEDELADLEKAVQF